MISITVKSNGDGTYWVNDGKKEIAKTMTELTREEARKLLKEEVRKANRRISNIVKRGLYSPAIEGLKRYGGNEIFTVSSDGKISLHSKGGGMSGIFNSISVIENFLSYETSTVLGAQRYKKDVESRLGLKNVSSKTLGVIWRLINRAREVNPVIANYSRLGRYVYNIVSNSVDNISDIDEMTENEIEEMIDRSAMGVAKKIQDLYYENIRGIGK